MDYEVSTPMGKPINVIKKGCFNGAVVTYITISLDEFNKARPIHTYRTASDEFKFTKLLSPKQHQWLSY
ncbi:MAG: hypothetical protein JWR02_2596 [Mucilaginibacter sp.]|nr:hypothetical protein [Mucilaginibacter sp.]